MPELPEVESVRLSLLPHILDKRITEVEVRHVKTVRSDHRLVEFLTGKKITGIRRYGKLLVFDLNNSEYVLCVHLKMTGQFMYEGKNTKVGGGHSLSKNHAEDPHKHTRVVIRFSDLSTLYFNDLRLFGYFKLVETDQMKPIIEGYGIEPGTASFTWAAFKKIFEKRNTNLKALLLNQAVIAGLGNIYVDEVCFDAGVKPQRNVKKLTEEETKKLFKACERIIADAIKSGGTTFQYYNDANGKQGSYRQKLKVFGRQGQQCLRCKKGIIKKVKWAGRGTHFCPNCQK